MSNGALYPHQLCTVCNGVRQGGILSPYLFALYVDGLSVELINSNAGCTINNRFVNHFFYADDMCLVAPSAMGLQTLIDIAYKYGSDFYIGFNPKKSMCMVTKPSKFHLKCPTVTLNAIPMTYKNKVKYLGVFISSDLSDNIDMTRQMRSLYARANILLRKFNKCSVDIMKTLFQTYCTKHVLPLLMVKLHPDGSQ